MPILHYLPEVLILTRGWYCFFFRCPEDSELILSLTWLCGKGSLMLKHWDHLFNPENEIMRFRHLWVQIPNCPLFLWNLEAFTAIGNHLGRFLHVEHELLVGNDRRIAKLLVEIDITHGLLANLSIEWRGSIFELQLDYWGLPFRCSTCSRVGHLKAKFPGWPIQQMDCPGLMTSLPTENVAMVDASQADERMLIDPSLLSSQDAALIGKLKLASPNFVSSLSF